MPPAADRSKHKRSACCRRFKRTTVQPGPASTCIRAGLARPPCPSRLLLPRTRAQPPASPPPAPRFAPAALLLRHREGLTFSSCRPTRIAATTPDRHWLLAEVLPRAEPTGAPAYSASCTVDRHPRPTRCRASGVVAAGVTTRSDLANPAALTRPSASQPSRTARARRALMP